MSNYVSRTLTVSRDAYNRLQDLAAQATSLRDRLLRVQDENRTLQSDLADANHYIRQSEQQFDNIWAELTRSSAENAELQAAISQAHTRITNHAQEVQESLSQMQSEFVTFVENSIHDNNLLIDQVITENTRTLTGMIDTLRNDTNQALDSLRNQVDTLVHGDLELLEDAQNYSSQISAIVHAIGQTRHALLLPGQYDTAVKPQIDTASDDLSVASKNPAYAPTARASARSAFLTALQFLENITTAEQEWQAQLVITEQLAELVEEQIEGSRTIALTPNTPPKDVNVWSRGAFEETEQIFTNTREILKKPEMLDDLSTQQLIDLQSSFQNISSDLNNIVTDAYVECNTSQRMTVIAQRVNVALASAANMQVIAHAHEDGDERGNYRFITRNPSTGLTVTVTVSRVSRGENSIELFTEADIVDYGTMAASTAESLIRNTVNAITDAVAGTVGGESGCHGHNEIIHAHEHRGDITVWEHPVGNTAPGNK